MLIELAVGLFVVATLLLLKIRQLEATWRDAGIPYESYWSYLHCHYVRMQKEVVFDVVREYSERYGPVFGTYQGLKPMLRISSVEGAKDALIKNFSSLPRRGVDVAVGVPLWDNVMTALPYNQWKLVRQTSGTAFTSSKLRGLTSKVEQLADRFSDKLVEIASSEGRLEPFVHAQGYVLDAIAAVAYGLDLDAIANPHNAFVEHSKDIFAPGVAAFIIGIAPSMLKYVPFVQFPSKKTISFFENFGKTIISQRKKRGLASSLSKSEYDMLDIWLREQQNNPEFSDGIIMSQMFVFLIAGFDTTAYTLVNTLYFLAMHPEEQARALDEINTVRMDGNTSFDDFNKLKFVEACILEALRLCPPDVAVDRVCETACTVAGVPVKPGTAVHVSVPGLHRNPDYFPDPDAFRPARFLDGSSNLDAYMGFGDGPKNCIGKRLVLLLLTVVVASILKKLRVTRCTATPAKLDFLEGLSFLPFPKQPIVVGLEKRDG